MMVVVQGCGLVVRVGSLRRWRRRRSGTKAARQSNNGIAYEMFKCVTKPPILQYFIIDILFFRN